MLLRADASLIFVADLPTGGATSCPPYATGCDNSSPLKQGHLIALSAASGDVLWSAPIPGMRTLVCNKQIPNILRDGTLVISGGTFGGVTAFRGGAPLSRAAPWPKYGADPALTGRRPSEALPLTAT